MALTDRVAAAAPYAQQLLYNRDVQASARDASQAARSAYRRARGKDASEIAQDKKLRQQVDKAVAAVGALFAEVQKSPPKRSTHRGRRVIALLLLAAVGAVIANEGLRARLMSLVRDVGGTSGESGDSESGAAAAPASPQDQNGDSVG